MRSKTLAQTIALAHSIVHGAILNYEEDHDAAKLLRALHTAREQLAVAEGATKQWLHTDEEIEE